MTDVHPNKGGAAPAIPPMTIFCGVACFKNNVYPTAYPINAKKVKKAVNILTKKLKIYIPRIPKILANNKLFLTVTLP